MTKPKDTVPAAPTPPATPPASDTGAGTSGPPDALTALAGAGSPLPPASNELQEFTPLPKAAPGAEEFDVAGASEEEFDQHFKILERKAKLAKLTATDSSAQATTQAPVPVTVVDAPVTPASPQPALVTKTDRHGQEHALPQATWDAMGTKRLAEFTDKPAQVAKPADIL